MTATAPAPSPSQESGRRFGAAEREPGEAGAHAGPAAARVVGALEHEHGGALARGEPVTPAVEGPRRAGRERAETAVAVDHGGGELVDAATHHGVRASQPEEVRRERDGAERRGVLVVDRGRVALQAELDRDLGRRRVHHRGREERGVGLRRSQREELAHEAGGRLQRAEPGADDDPDPIRRDLRERGALGGLLGRQHRHLHEPREAS